MTNEEYVKEELPDLVERKARDMFGVAYMYPVQRFVVANMLEGKNQIVILPTGAGKSLCFQVASEFMEGITLVIVPLLALLKDQLRGLKERGIPAGELRGGQAREERKKLFLNITRGNIKLVLVTPEILFHEDIRNELSKITISNIVIDEAHCVSEWGKSFRPAYLKIGDAIEALPAGIVTAFTATGSAQVVEDIQRLVFRDRAVVRTEDVPDRPNIFYRVIPVLSKTRELVKICREQEKPLVVFARSRRGAEMYASVLHRRLPGMDLRFYHAGLTPEERKECEEWFLASGNGILVSTSAYGMGVDKKNIRTVVHSDIPPSGEAYLQESGRAGRDGNPSKALLIYNHDDLHYGPELESSFGRERYGKMCRYALSEYACRRVYLLGLMGAECAFCSGCDKCLNTEIKEPEAEREIMNLLGRHPRRFTRRQLTEYLHGRLSPADAGTGRLAGVLKDWESEDIEEALEILMRNSVIKVTARGFWKYRLSLCS